MPNVREFVDPGLLPTGAVRIAAFDGENADPSNGRPLGEGVRAYTPWGELAYALAGRAGYERVRRSDEEGGARLHARDRQGRGRHRRLQRREPLHR